MRNFTLTRLIKPEVLQQIQDAFSDFTGLAAVTTNADGVPVTRVSNFTNFCTNIIRGTDIGLRCCQKCDKDGAVKTMHSGCPVVYRCHAGLIDFAAPIMFNGRMIGTLSAVRHSRRTLTTTPAAKKQWNTALTRSFTLLRQKKLS